MTEKRDHFSEKLDKLEGGATASHIEERYDLICPAGLRRLALRYGLGAKKHGEHNWCMGMPKNRRLNHLMKHVHDYLKYGNKNDDNLAAIAWNAFALMHYEEDCKHHEAFKEEVPESLESRVLGYSWICSRCKMTFDENVSANITRDGKLLCKICHRVLSTTKEYENAREKEP